MYPGNLQLSFTPPFLYSFLLHHLVLICSLCLISFAGSLSNDRFTKLVEYFWLMQAIYHQICWCLWSGPGKWTWGCYVQCTYCTLQTIPFVKFPLTFLLADTLLVFYRSDIWVGLCAFSDREIENILRFTKAQLPAQGTHTSTGMWLLVVDGSRSALTIWRYLPDLQGECLWTRCWQTVGYYPCPCTPCTPWVR